MMTGSFVSWPWIIRIHTEFNSMLGQCWIVFHECWVWNHEKEIKLGDIPTLANSPWNQPLKFLMECWLYILEGRVISYLRSGWLNQQHWEIHSAKAGFRKSPMRIQYMKLIIKTGTTQAISLLLIKSLLCGAISFIGFLIQDVPS